MKSKVILEKENKQKITDNEMVQVSELVSTIQDTQDQVDEIEDNLKAKKEEAELDAWAEQELQRVEPQPDIKPPPKKRGRPRKKKEEPPAPQFIPPPDPQLASGYGYPQQRGQVFNPYGYYQPPPTPAPVNNYYYYGAPPPEPKEEPKPEAHPVFEPPAEPQVTFQEPPPQEEEEVEYETYASPDPRLKFRFA